MLVRRIDDRPAGFIGVLAAEDLTGTSCIEMFIIHVAQSMRGTGGCGMMVNMITEGYKSHHIIARCYPASKRVNKMHQQRGFSQAVVLIISACFLPELLFLDVLTHRAILHRNEKVICSLNVIHLYY